MRRGASLVELFVAAAVLATLAAISVTAYQTARDRTSDNTTAANLQSAAASQLRHQHTRGRYALTEEDISSLSVREVTVTTGPSTGPSVISVSDDGDGVLLLASRSASRSCLVLRISPQEQDTEPQNHGSSPCIASLYRQT